MGEREYDLLPLRELVGTATRSTCGSPTSCAWAASRPGVIPPPYAAAHGIPVLPHYYRDYDVPLLCTVGNAYGAESFDWIDAIVDSPMRVEGGLAWPREGAGWGFRFKASGCRRSRSACLVTRERATGRRAR